MAKQQVMFTFPPELIKEPIIFNLGLQFKVIPNIRRADISENKGWVVLEMEGRERYRGRHRLADKQRNKSWPYYWQRYGKKLRSARPFTP